jgi:undecaprenyl-diphosphatase
MRSAAVAVVAGVLPTLLILLAAVRLAPVEITERRVASALNAQVLPRPTLAGVLEVLAVTTHPNVWRAVAAVVAVVLWVRGRRRLAIWLACTMAVGGLLGPFLKEVVARERPSFDKPVTTASGYSCPSGHALGSMLFAACLVVLARGVERLVVGTTGAAIVVVTGAGRIALGVHYVSDVLAGWAVGLATVVVTAVAFGVLRTAETVPPPRADG